MPGGVTEGELPSDRREPTSGASVLGATTSSGLVRARVDHGGPKKPKFRPGMLALKEIKRMQAQSQPVLARLPFQRLVRDIARAHDKDIRFSSQALLALQEASECYLTGLFADSYLVAQHAKRATLLAKDMQLARSIRGEPAMDRVSLGVPLMY